MNLYSDKPAATSPLRELDPRVAAHLLRSRLVEDHGTPEVQKDVLVSTITSAFTNPEDWPIDDAARIHLLKDLYTRALRIRQTERAIEADQS